MKTRPSPLLLVALASLAHADDIAMEDKSHLPARLTQPW
jgi:L-fucose mutarotase/ribose pyranase (RbsD/FucU family)